MSSTIVAPSQGRVDAEVAEALAWLHSPAAISGEIRHLEQAIREGDISEATRVQLADWRAVRAAQARLVAPSAAPPRLP